jgi:hypothetical protein
VHATCASIGGVRLPIGVVQRLQISDRLGGSLLADGEPTCELIVALTTVFYEASLVNWKQHAQTIERCYSRGLTHKLSTGRPYDDFAAVVTGEHFEKSDRLGIRVPPAWRDIPVPAPVCALAWRNAPGPGYSKQKSETMIRNRYQRSSEILCQTIPRLANDPQFRETYEELASQGWKDWHVGDRYGYWSDDVPHTPLIEPSAETSADLS